MSDVVHLHDICHSYSPGNPVLLNVSLDVAPGNRVALLGESGAGKSTLLRCINGLVNPESGEVNVLGANLRNLSQSERAQLRRRIGMIFQEFNVHDRLTVFHNVLIGRLGYANPLLSNLGRFSANDLALARACIEQVGLASFSHVRVKNLSGGQKQRVGIARALAQQPDILLGDEPTANLDVRTSREILELLRTISVQHGTTLILAMHDIALAVDSCDRIIGIREGRIVFEGGASEVNTVVMQQIFY